MCPLVDASVSLSSTAIHQSILCLVLNICLNYLSRIAVRLNVLAYVRLNVLRQCLLGLAAPSTSVFTALGFSGSARDLVEYKQTQSTLSPLQQRHTAENK